MNTLQRTYRTIDAVMQIASATIVEAAIVQKDFLQSKRSTWADPFFQNLQQQIDNVIRQYLGVD